MANRRQQHVIELLNWYSAMVGAYAAMPETKRKELYAWEAENLDGCTVATSDWPGWIELIGRRPQRTERERTEDRKGFVYLVLAETGHSKIGRTTNVDARLRNFRNSTPIGFQLLHSFPADDSFTAERLLHKKFEGLRVRGEWFALDQDGIQSIQQIVSFIDGKFMPTVFDTG